MDLRMYRYDAELPKRGNNALSGAPTSSTFETKVHSRRTCGSRPSPARAAPMNTSAILSQDLGACSECLPVLPVGITPVLPPDLGIVWEPTVWRYITSSSHTMGLPTGSCVPSIHAAYKVESIRSRETVHPVTHFL